MLEQEHIIQTLKAAREALKKEDVVEIKALSNKTIHSASIYQDPDNIGIAVILYALSKLVERRAYQDYKGWDKFEKNYRVCLDKSILALEKKDLEDFRTQISCIRNHIKSLSGDLKIYIEDVFRKASINKASSLHEHGLSIGKTAKILGLTMWELNQYIGQTKVGDVNLAYTLELKDRIQLAEEIFGK